MNQVTIVIKCKSAAQGGKVECFEEIDPSYQDEEYYPNDDTAGWELDQIHLCIENEADDSRHQETPYVEHRLFDLWVLQSIENRKADERAKHCIDEEVEYGHSPIQVVL